MIVCREDRYNNWNEVQKKYFFNFVSRYERQKSCESTDNAFGNSVHYIDKNSVVHDFCGSGFSVLHFVSIEKNESICLMENKSE